MNESLLAITASRRVLALAAALVASSVAVSARVDAVDVDLSGLAPDCAVRVRQAGEALEVAWPLEAGREGFATIDLAPGRPLVRDLGVAGAGGARVTVLAGVDPAFFLTVGSRKTPEAKPADQRWAVFFDNPARRAHERFLGAIALESATASGRGTRATVSLGRLDLGEFSGRVEFTFYAGAALVRVEAMVTTGEDLRAITYDAGLLAGADAIRRAGWIPAGEHAVRTDEDPGGADRSPAVRHRLIALETEAGAVAVFPPPHQFFFPRDWSDNLATVWLGAGHLGLTPRFGFGVRQPATGGGPFVPWFNAPPGTAQRLAFFVELTAAGDGGRGALDAAIEQALRWTRRDRFPRLPGHRSFTSHYHMAISVAAMDRRRRGLPPLAEPDFVRVFKDMGVDMVHLGEFHGDGHQKDPGPLRLPELDAMFEECRRLSDGEILVIPGEELNCYLGLREPGKHPGHWMSLFPRPVHWIVSRKPDEPFVTEDPVRGRVYRVGGREDMMRLLEAERGLVWAAHPRIKASSWTPDIFRREDFFLSDHWVGGAWKAMPGDLSQPRLGGRVLDLLDDMANWASWEPAQAAQGERKYVLGEVDVFKIDRTHELYGHMNVNYLRLDRLPRFEDGWAEVLEALRAGRFFVTTGEVLVREFTIGGRRSGETLRLGEDAGAAVEADLEWTFPLAFAELVTGDGERVHRERIELDDTGPFGKRRLSLRPRLAGRRWARLEVWDIAANGAFTQPIWID